MNRIISSLDYGKSIAKKMVYEEHSLHYKMTMFLVIQKNTKIGTKFFLIKSPNCLTLSQLIISRF